MTDMIDLPDEGPPDPQRTTIKVAPKAKKGKGKSGKGSLDGAGKGGKGQPDIDDLDDDAPRAAAKPKPRSAPKIETEQDR